MPCQDIERLIIFSSEEDLSVEELSEIKQHVSECSRCVRFQEDLGKIIGKRGRTAEAIRTILNAASTKLRKRCVPPHSKLDSPAVSGISSFLSAKKWRLERGIPLKYLLTIQFTTNIKF